MYYAIPLTALGIGIFIPLIMFTDFVILVEQGYALFYQILSFLGIQFPAAFLPYFHFPVLLSIFYIIYYVGIIAFGMPKFLFYAVGISFICGNTLARLMQLQIPDVERVWSPLNKISGSVRMHNTLYLLANLFNEAFRYIIFSHKIILVAMASVSYALGILHGLGTPSLCLCTFATLLLLALVINFGNAGRYFDSSQDYVRSLRLKIRDLATTPGVFGTLELLGVQKRIEAMRCSRIESGSQYYVDRGVVPKILDAIVNNTISIVLAN